MVFEGFLEEAVFDEGVAPFAACHGGDIGGGVAEFFGQEGIGAAREGEGWVLAHFILNV